MRQHTVVLLTVCILLMASMGLNRCNVGTADCVACRYGTPALRCADIHTAYACQLFHRQRHLLPQFRLTFCALLPASVVMAVFSAGDQAVRKRVAWTQRRRCIARTPAAAHSVAAWSYTAALLPYPGFTAAGLAAIGNFARHGEVFFRSASPPV